MRKQLNIPDLLGLAPQEVASSNPTKDKHSKPGANGDLPGRQLQDPEIDELCASWPGLPVIKKKKKTRTLHKLLLTRDIRGSLAI